MKPHPYTHAAIVAGVLLLFGSCLLAADNTAGLLIEQTLDGPADRISFANVSLEEALASLSKSLGIPFDIDEPALSKLPYGRLTRLASVQLHDLTWREAMTELLEPLALRFQVGDKSLFVMGTAELVRQPRRVNLAELNALVKLQSSTLNDSEEKLLKQLYEVTEIRFGLITGGQQLEKASKDTIKKILNETNQPATRVLDLYCRWLAGGTDQATWYLQADPKDGEDAMVNIVIVRWRELLEKKLDQQITIEFRNEPIQSILQELARQATLEISFEPGCFALLDDHLRESVSLVLRAGTIRSALESLMGMTGLQYSIEEKLLTIEASENLRTMALSRSQPSGSQRSPLACILKATIPDTDIETMVFVREDMLEAEGLLETFRKLQKGRVDTFITFLRELESDK